MGNIFMQGLFSVKELVSSGKRTLEGSCCPDGNSFPENVALHPDACLQTPGPHVAWEPLPFQTPCGPGARQIRPRGSWKQTGASGTLQHSWPQGLSTAAGECSFLEHSSSCSITAGRQDGACLGE